MISRLLPLLILLFSSCIQPPKIEPQNMTIEQRFSEWMELINENEEIDNSIVGFNFGLFETSDGFEMYLIGSRTFDLENEDWATKVDFEPKQKYFHFGKEVSADMNWSEFLQFVESLVSNYINSKNFESSILADAIGITTGFDDGNLVLIYKKEKV